MPTWTSDEALKAAHNVITWQVADGGWSKNIAMVSKARAPGEATMPPPRHANDPNPERRLRIGYVSPDFRQHAVTRYFETAPDGSFCIDVAFFKASKPTP